MLIVTDFHDYYDKAIGYGGVDKTVVYQRKEEITEINLNYKDVEGRLYSENPKNSSTDYNIQGKIVGIAGELHPVIVCKKYKWKTNDRQEEFKYFYNKEDALEWMKTEKIESQGSWWFGTNIDDMFDEDKWEFLKQYFVLMKTPVFIYEKRVDQGSGYQIRSNPRLKDIEFYKVKDAFTMFQDVYMYISGVLGNLEKEVAEISDVAMRDKKGFNEWSFKREEAKKRKRKK